MRDDLAHVIRAVEQGEKEIRLKGYITKLLVKLTDLIYAHQVMNVKMNEMGIDKEQLRIIVTERDTLQGLIDPTSFSFRPPPFLVVNAWALD